MADIDRDGTSLEIIDSNSELKKKHIQILINEKTNQIKQLEVRLDHMKTVEMKQIELRIETLQIEVNRLITELTKTSRDQNENTDQIIDVEGKEG
jgi:hypothetical protein